MQPPKMLDYPSQPLQKIHMQWFLESSSVTANWIWNMQVCSTSYVPALIGTKQTSNHGICCQHSFYQLLHNRHPDLAETVKLNLRKDPQTFDV